MSANTTHTAVCPCCGYEHDTDARGQRQKFKEFAVYAAAPQMLEALRSAERSLTYRENRDNEKQEAHGHGRNPPSQTLCDVRRAIAAGEGRT